MLQTFRLSMTWLHTWFGLVLGFVLVVVFFFGALSVFDREIDRWAVPATRFAPQPMPSVDRVLKPIFERIVPDADDLATAAGRVNGPLAAELPVMDWSAYTTHRDPVLRVFKSFALPNAKDPDDHIHGHLTIDARNGNVLPEGNLNIGSEFFYPLHYHLHIDWLNLGYWIVGLAALAMLAALVSGLVIHRRIWREFFTFRPRKRTQRSALDLHNLTGVVALPFHFMFALSGLIIFAGSIYLPVGEKMMKPLATRHDQARAEAKNLPFKPAGRPAELASVDAMVTEAQRRWAARGMAGEVGFLFINHVGDVNATVSIYRAGTDRIALTGEGIHFAGTSGRVLYEDPPQTVVETINTFVTGLHLQHFRHWLLRWLYFIGGLAGAVCIATGFIFFVEKRKHQHARQGSGGARWVDALAVATVTGTLIATTSMLVLNRLLPAGIEHRGDWEQLAFWLAWLVALLHALWRSAPVCQTRIAPAWWEQCWAVAALALSAVLLNWATTGDHLVRTLSDGYWPVAGVDLVLLAGSALAVLAAHRVHARALAGAVVPDDDTATASLTDALPEADRA